MDTSCFPNFSDRPLIWGLIAGRGFTDGLQEMPDPIDERDSSRAGKTSCVWASGLFWEEGPEFPSDSPVGAGPRAEAWPPDHAAGRRRRAARDASWSLGGWGCRPLPCLECAPYPKEEGDLTPRMHLPLWQPHPLPSSKQDPSLDGPIQSPHLAPEVSLAPGWGRGT